MPHENLPPEDAQLPGEESGPNLRVARVLYSWSEPARDAVAALSSILLEGDIERRIKAHNEHGDWERRIVINELRKATLNKKQIRFVFRHYGLKVPKDGLKTR